MLDFVAEHFADCAIFAVFFIAIFPALESKVSIPFALSKPIWGAATLSPLMTFIVSFVGTMLPSILVIWFARKLKNKTSGFVYDKLILRFQNKFQKHFDKLSQKTSILKKCIFLGSFVALPLPLTGVYTGSLIAGFTNLKIWQCWLSIFIGELFTCIGMVIICTLFENSAFYMLVMSIVVGFIAMVINGIIRLVNFAKKRKAQKQNLK